ncbi:NAD-dependent DNA ligase LigA [Metamycoplasma equirhinis]|uniref:NAD-dependent DNA ligase LigA n=1 Tax=Metamycoplasma equirhinis TaxID=92402 RepID=UPI0035945720
METREEIRKIVFELQQKINEWDHQYYDLDNPTVSDAIYDSEFNKLKKLEEKYPYFFSYEELKLSPTQKINATSLDIFTKVKHDKPMLSLNKAYSIEEISKFISNIEKITKEYSFFIEPKIDGLSISIKYKNGKLFQAVTRGNGIIGEDVTENILQIQSIPKEISLKDELEVRGEIYLPIDDFNKLNNNLELMNKPKMANPRNAAAGTLRQLNSQIVKERNLSAFLYYIVNPEKYGIKTMQEEFQFLRKYNFQISTEAQLVKSMEEIRKYVHDFKTKKQLLNYETDGIVIKLNQLEFYDKLGYTAKFPHSAIAFKYEPDTVATLLKKIFVTVGRTGLVTYNALLEPVELSGSLVSYATLNNFDYIDNLNINENDLVYVKKAGEIIPCVIGLALNKNKGQEKFKKILNCPFCQSEFIDSDTKLEQYCSNKNCPEIIKRKLIHFASKDALDIITLGEKNIELLIDKNFIKKPEDFFLLKNHKDKLLELNRMGHRSVLKMLDAIESSKHKSLEKLIFALSIKHIGVKIAKFIASKVRKLSNFLTFDFASLKEYNEIGEKITTSLILWVSEFENQELINNLINLDMDLEYNESTINNKLQGKTFVITGTLSKPRNYFEKIIIENGGSLTNSISSKTSYLIYGHDAGSKLSKAKNLNVELLTEDDFSRLI